MDVLFLDANVLFSAAYSPESPLRVFWRLGGLELVTSSYAADEARRNLAEPGRRARLEELLVSVRIEAQITPVLLPPDIALPEKDLPILIGAIASGATHLVTGDRRHFGALYGRTIMGVTVVLPADYLTHSGER